MTHFNGLGLLTIGLICFVIVMIFAAYLALKAWKLAKRGFRISKVALPLAEGLGRRSEDLAKLGYHIGLKVDQIAINLNELDASVRRLQVLLQAFNDALRPYRKVRNYLGL
jgi:hypothetical protein